MHTLLIVAIVHLAVLWWVIRHTGFHTARPVATPPINVVLLASAPISVAAELAPLTARFLKSEPGQAAQVDFKHSRVAQRTPTKEVRVVDREPALAAESPVMPQLPALQEPRPAQSGGKSALVLPDFRDSYFKQKSAGEMASEQLNPDGKQGRWAAAIQRTAVPDCVEEKVGGGLLGIPVLIYKAASGKCK